MLQGFVSVKAFLGVLVLGESTETSDGIGLAGVVGLLLVSSVVLSSHLRLLLVGPHLDGGVIAVLSNVVFCPIRII